MQKFVVEVFYCAPSISLTLDEEQNAEIKYVNRLIEKIIDTYFQSIGRKLSVLEGPLVAARGDGKCYTFYFR